MFRACLDILNDAAARAKSLSGLKILTIGIVGLGALALALMAPMNSVKGTTEEFSTQSP